MSPYVTIDNATMTVQQQIDFVKRRRRWFQFSLRSLLIITALVAISCGVLGSKIERKRREREAVKAIEMRAGYVAYDFEVAGLKEPFGPSWLRELLGENFFSEITLAQLNNVGDDEIAEYADTIKGFPKLKELRLCAPGLSDSGLIYLSPLTQLESLVFDESHVSDAGIAELQKALPSCTIYH
jgi:hypothetical protein